MYLKRPREHESCRSIFGKTSARARARSTLCRAGGRPVPSLPRGRREATPTHSGVLGWAAVVGAVRHGGAMLRRADGRRRVGSRARVEQALCLALLACYRRAANPAVERAASGVSGGILSPATAGRLPHIDGKVLRFVPRRPAASRELRAAICSPSASCAAPARRRRRRRTPCAASVTGGRQTRAVFAAWPSRGHADAQRRARLGSGRRATSVGLC